MKLNNPTTLISAHLLGIGFELSTSKVGVGRSLDLDVNAIAWSWSWSRPPREKASR